LILYPEFTLEGVDGIEVSKSIASVEEGDVDVMIAKLQEQKKDWQASEQGSQTGDQVSITEFLSLVFSPCSSSRCMLFFTSVRNSARSPLSIP
jgi:hypothetical protein